MYEESHVFVWSLSLRAQAAGAQWALALLFALFGVAATATAVTTRKFAKRAAAAGTASGVAVGGQSSAPDEDKRATLRAAIARYDWHAAAELADGGGGTFYEVACEVSRVDHMARRAEAGDLRGALDLVVSAREEAAVRAHPAGTPWGGGGAN